MQTHEIVVLGAGYAGLAAVTQLAARLAAFPAGAPGRVVVVGTGLTGIETAAEIAERFPSLDVGLVGRAEPAGWMRPRARAHVERALDRLGVRVLAGRTVTEVRP